MNIAVQVVWIRDNVVEGDWLHSIDHPVLFHFNSKFNKDIKYPAKRLSGCTTLFLLCDFNTRFNQGINHTAIKTIGFATSPLFMLCQDKAQQKYKAFCQKDKLMHYAPPSFQNIGTCGSFLLKLSQSRAIVATTTMCGKQRFNLLF